MITVIIQKIGFKMNWGFRMSREVYVTAYPFAIQGGTIQVPNDITGYKEVAAYIDEHWSEIDFNPPELDYGGTDFDFEEE